MTIPTDVLRDEHMIILRGLDLLEAAAARLEAGTGPPESWWDEALTWFRDFADRNHHAKEENSLFPAMIKAGAPAAGCPVDVMLEEHAEGRALLQAMTANDPRERTRVVRQYAQLLRDHIDKEHGIVFPLAEAILDEQALEWIAHEFNTVEAEQGDRASLDSAQSVVDGLGAALGSATHHREENRPDMTNRGATPGNQRRHSGPCLVDLHSPNEASAGWRSGLGCPVLRVTCS